MNYLLSSLPAVVGNEEKASYFQVRRLPGPEEQAMVVRDYGDFPKAPF